MLAVPSGCVPCVPAHARHRDLTTGIWREDASQNVEQHGSITSLKPLSQQVDQFGPEGFGCWRRHSKVGLVAGQHSIAVKATGECRHVVNAAVGGGGMWRGRLRCHGTSEAR